MVGALLALALTMKSLNIFTMLGVIMLIGLVGKNAILLVDRTNQMRANGLAIFDALIEAGQTRLRPILMTTVSMVLGMLPTAIATGAGGEWKSGLGWALIGGLTSSMFLTLILIPSVYITVDNVRTAFPTFIKKLFRKSHQKKNTTHNYFLKLFHNV
jgi:HAE1 family hydrophobic/amphiphilic exporter-1